MSITDELREFADEFERTEWNGLAERAREIANRIDAEHERMYTDLTIGMEPMDEEHMAEHGWVKLPVDADGETIRIGDRLKAGSREFTVLGIGRCYDGSEEFGVFSQCLDGDYEWFNAEYLSHVQPDTWERIIEDAAWYGRERQFIGTNGDCERIAALVERCRRLAGER